MKFLRIQTRDFRLIGYDLLVSENPTTFFLAQHAAAGDYVAEMVFRSFQLGRRAFAGGLFGTNGT